jgi:ABC-2 type transport system permease protein
VLRAKNAAVAVLALLIFAGSAAALFATAGIPPAWALLSALALHLGVGTWYVAAGNLVSILNPRPASYSLQRGGGLSAVSALAGMGIVSAGAALFVPPVLLALHLDEPWVLAAGWVLLGLAGWGVRRAVFRPTARLLARRREAVLSAVAGETP